MILGSCHRRHTRRLSGVILGDGGVCPADTDCGGGQDHQDHPLLLSVSSMHHSRELGKSLSQYDLLSMCFLLNKEWMLSSAVDNDNKGYHSLNWLDMTGRGGNVTGRF